MSKTALLLIDVLKGIFHLDVPLHRPDDFLEKAVDLQNRARASGTPVVHIRHQGPPGSFFAPGSPNAEIHPAVQPLADEVVIEKSHPDAFQDSPLKRALNEFGIGKVIICGFATEGCVDTTVRSAYAKGFKVILAADGHTTTGNEVFEAGKIIAHHNLVLARFADVKPAEDIKFPALS